MSDETEQSSVEIAINDLEQGAFSKLICGASNTNVQQVERLALVYSLAGINVIDVSAKRDVFEAAKRGISSAKEIYRQFSNKYLNYNEPVIMLSINAGEDSHFRKAQFNLDYCINCLQCTFFCPSGALTSQNNNLLIKSDSCYGCGRCLGACARDVITLKKTQSFELEEFVNKEIKIDSIEIHIGNNKKNQLQEFVQSNTEVLNSIKLISVSIEANHFSPIQIKSFAGSIVDLFQRKVIIQVDGAPMSGNNQNFSGVQSITYANILVESQLDAYMQVAGGANHLTKKYLDLFNIKVAGIGYGTFARKIILSFIDNLNDYDFKNNLNKSVNIATSLVKTSRNLAGNSI